GVVDHDPAGPHGAEVPGDAAGRRRAHERVVGGEQLVRLAVELVDAQVHVALLVSPFARAYSAPRTGWSRLARGEPCRLRRASEVHARKVAVTPKIELYFWAGCPSHPEALELLEAVLAERGIEAAIEVREVFTHEQAEELSFPGSPTILVDGRDVDPGGAQGRRALVCRVYRLPDGRPSPVPSREQLEEALT